jgi:hypothetical protein
MPLADDLAAIASSGQDIQAKVQAYANVFNRLKTAYDVSHSDASLASISLFASHSKSWRG